MPPFDSVAELNQLLQSLAADIWNPLTAHQTPGRPFRFTRLETGRTQEEIHNFALVRRQEVEGFLDGLFGPNRELRLSARGHKTVEVLTQMRDMLMGVTELLTDKSQSGSATELAGLAETLEALAGIAEHELNAAVLECSRARRAGVGGIRQGATRQKTRGRGPSGGRSQ